MSGLTLTISRDKEVLVVIGAGGELLVEADDPDRRELFAKLQYALMTIADLDGPWRQGISDKQDKATLESKETPHPAFDGAEAGTVISLAARRAAKEPGAAV